MLQLRLGTRDRLFKQPIVNSQSIPSLLLKAPFPSLPSLQLGRKLVISAGHFSIVWPFPSADRITLTPMWRIANRLLSLNLFFPNLSTLQGDCSGRWGVKNQAKVKLPIKITWFPSTSHAIVIILLLMCRRITAYFLEFLSLSFITLLFNR